MRSHCVRVDAPVRINSLYFVAPTQPIPVGVVENYYCGAACVRDGYIVYHIVCIAVDQLQLRLTGVTSAQHQRNIDAVQLHCTYHIAATNRR